MASFVTLTGKCIKFLPNMIFSVTKRLQRIERNEFSKYRLQLNFTNHCLAMSQRVIIPKFANFVPALVLTIHPINF